MARRIAVWYYLSPTDAVVVLSLLHAATIKLKLLITATLEIDSGSNDPLAVLLTISIIEMLQARKPTINLIVFQSILLEIGLGALIGITAGYLIIWFANRIKVAESLYPLLVLSSDMLIFSSTNLLGGSGYLAIYLGGIIISNNQIHQRENILRLHDSLA